MCILAYRSSRPDPVYRCLYDDYDYEMNILKELYPDARPLSVMFPSLETVEDPAQRELATKTWVSGPAPAQQSNTIRMDLNDVDHFMT